MSDIEEIKVPDIGDFDSVEVIEVLAKVGDTINAEDPIISLESDKATMEVPSPAAGEIVEMLIKEGDQVSTGSPMMKIKPLDSSTNQEKEDSETSAEKQSDTTDGETNNKKPEQVEQEVKPDEQKTESVPRKLPPVPETVATEPSGKLAHASPAIRKFARELGVEISTVSGTGPKGRITKEDVKQHIKQRMRSGGNTISSGFDVAPPPSVDFTEFGEIETRPLSRIQKISGKYLHRNWVRIPHVTQYDEADITELESFRQQNKADAKEQGFNLTPLAFIVKAMAKALKKFPKFNASLDVDGENLIYKKYFHIGIAVDTKDGLVVPVIRDCDKKEIFEISKEMAEISVKARDGKLSPKDMQGGSISISSLGGIGGTAFTPIINAPEVAILGVSRSSMKPVYDGAEFQPRLMLPLCLSYDHRVIDGADAARFIVYLSSVLSDLKKMLL